MIQMKTLGDLDLMPFGKYKGTPMQDVPAGYLNWLWNNGMKDDKQSIVGEYISHSLGALKQENRDLIWD